MGNLKDYYAKEQRKKDERDVLTETALTDRQIQLANNLRDLIANLIDDILILAENTRPEAYPVTWRIKRKLNFIQTRFGADEFTYNKSFAWDIGSNYFLTINGKLLIQRRRGRDNSSHSFYYIESFPSRGSMDDPYSACEHLIDFMEKLGASSDEVSKKRNLFKQIKG